MEWPFARWDSEALTFDKSTMKCHGEKSWRELEEEKWPCVWWDWEGLYAHDFPLNKLPKRVVEDVARYLSNKDRRYLSLTCHRMFHLFDGCSPTMDRRHVVEIYFEHCKDREKVDVGVRYAEYSIADEDEVAKVHWKQYSGVNFLKKCANYVKMCTKKHVLKSVTWNMYDQWNKAITLEDMIGVAPEDLCSDFGIECPIGMTFQEESEMIIRFLDTANFKRILFSHLTRPYDREMGMYVLIVKTWCVENGHGFISCMGYIYSGFCKRVLNGKPFVVYGTEVDRDKVTDEMAWRQSEWNTDDDWISGDVDIPQTVAEYEKCEK